MKRMMILAPLALASYLCAPAMATDNYGYTISLTSDGTVVGADPGARLPPGSCKLSKTPSQPVSVSSGDRVQLSACAYGKGVYGATTNIGQISVDQNAQKLTVKSQASGWPGLVKPFTVNVYKCNNATTCDDLVGTYATTDGNHSVNISPFTKGMAIKINVTGGVPPSNDSSE